MKDKIKSILIAHGMYGIENLNEATRQILFLFGVVGRSELLVCDCKGKTESSKIDGKLVCHRCKKPKAN
jgi:hypothetical protein